jgi:hypothetical protein
MIPLAARIRQPEGGPVKVTMYRIEYHTEDKLLIAVTHDLPIEKVENAAIIGMIRYLSAVDGDYARMDVKTGAEVNSFRASPEEGTEMPLA